MVQEMPNNVPEELYNLTQLAEVSIAAGKLSTTTAPGEQYHPGAGYHYPAQYGAIKYYAAQHDSPVVTTTAYRHPAAEEYYHHSAAYHPLRTDSSSDLRIAASPSPPAVHHQPQQQQQQIQQHQSYSATKKKWKTNWEINRGMKAHQQHRGASKIRDTDERRGDYGDAYEATNLTYYTSTIRGVDPASSTTPAVPSRPGSSSSSSNSSQVPSEEQASSIRRHSYASEESEDSSYSYSHKVFDRKKSRTLSWNSGSSFSHGEETPRLGATTGGEHESSQEECHYNCRNEEREYHELSEASARGVSSGEDIGLTDDVHSCPECGKKYSTSSNLARHRQTHRSLQDKKARRCPHCSKVYVSMPAYSMHVRTHNQGCQCPTCGKCFSRPWLLQGHIRTHTGEKPFKCSVCQKAFADKSNLRAHVQTHSNTKPHSCSRCGKAFALKSYLYKHEDSSCMKNKTGKHPKQSHTKARRKADRDHSSHSSLDAFSSGFVRRQITHHHQQQQQQHHQSLQSPQAISPLDLALQTELQLKKDAVRAKIREVLEDNCKKSAQLKAATDNRISVIRTTGSTAQEMYHSRPSESQFNSSREISQVSLGHALSSGDSSYEYPRNYAVTA